MPKPNLHQLTTELTELKAALALIKTLQEQNKNYLQELTELQASNEELTTKVTDLEEKLLAKEEVTQQLTHEKEELKERVSLYPDQEVTIQASVSSLTPMKRRPGAINLRQEFTRQGEELTNSVQTWIEVLPK